MTVEDFLTVDLPAALTAVLAAVCCALPGNFLVLRRQALLGDAISHAVLPGIVESEMGSESAPDVEVIRRMTANGVYRRAAELGPVFQFLASDASATLTGSLVGAHDGISAGYSQEVMERLGADLA